MSSWQDLPNAPVPGTDLGALGEVPDGGARFLDFGSGPAVFRLLLLRSEAQVFAYVNRCPHFGVPLAQQPEQMPLKPHQSFSCNVHYARFRWQDGRCEFGDCEGESLLAIPVRIDAGRIWIV